MPSSLKRFRHGTPTVRRHCRCSFLHQNRGGNLLHGILAYLRFKDDGLITSENRVGCLDWFQMFKAKAGYFRIICEQVARFAPEETQELKFLQLRILLCVDTRKVRVVPHSKSVAIPLSPLSAHPPSTENWPLAHLRCMCRLASDEKAAEA